MLLSLCLLPVLPCLRNRIFSQEVNSWEKVKQGKTVLLSPVCLKVFLNDLVLRLLKPSCAQNTSLCFNSKYKPACWQVLCGPAFPPEVLCHLFAMCLQAGKNSWKVQFVFASVIVNCKTRIPLWHGVQLKPKETSLLTSVGFGSSQTIGIRNS